MQPVSTKQIVSYQPEGSDTTYRLAVPSRRQRSEIEAAIVDAGIRPMGAAQLRSILSSIIRNEIDDEDTKSRYLEAIERANQKEHEDALFSEEEEETESSEEQDEADQKREAQYREDLDTITMAELEVGHDPSYRKALAMQIRWEPTLRWFAVKHMLKGISGGAIKYRQHHGLVHDETLEEIERTDDYDALTDKALELMTVGAEEAKNSESPSQ